VNGYAFAAGLETALLADIRIAAQNAEFGALKRRWNIVGGDGMTVRLQGDGAAQARSLRVFAGAAGEGEANIVHGPLRNSRREGLAAARLVPFEHDRRVVVGFDHGSEVRPEGPVMPAARVVSSAEPPSDVAFAASLREIEMLFPIAT
jgi:hypothetical protein